MPKFIYIFAPATFALLAACGGGGDGDGGSTLVYGDDITIAQSGGAGSGALSTGEVSQLADAFDALSDALEADTYAAPVTRPTGSVMMTGYIGINEPSDPDFVTIGNLSITADFDAAMGGISGTAGDFRTFDNTGPDPVVDADLGGTLTITGDNSGNGFTATATGDLTSGMDTLNVDLNLSGDLFDVEGAPTYVGSVSGDFDVNGDNAANALEGDFVAF